MMNHLIMAAAPADRYQEAVALAGRRKRPAKLTISGPGVVIRLINQQMLVKGDPRYKDVYTLNTYDMVCGHAGADHQVQTKHKDETLEHLLCACCYLNLVGFHRHVEELRTAKAQHEEQLRTAKAQHEEEIRVLKLLVSAVDRKELEGMKPEDYATP